MTRALITFTKADRGDERAMLQTLIDCGAIKVTRCPPAVRENDCKLGRSNHSGVLAWHLDPRTLGDTAEEAETARREQMIAANEPTSRRKRVRHA